MVDTPGNTSEWQALDKAHHIHPFTDPKFFDRRGVRVMTRADGCYIWDSDGNKILDAMAGLWCVNIGYGNKEVVAAASRQLDMLPYYNTFFQSATPPQIALAARLTELTPGDLDHIFFANSGSEANDTVIRLVRHYWKVRGRPGKTQFIGRHKGYHGSTLAAVSLGGMKDMHALGNTMLPGFAHIMEPHWYVHGNGMDRDAFGLHAARKLEEKIVELGPDTVAAFIGEPIQGAGGVIDPPMTYWGEVQRICRKYDVLLVADEVICGFGRLGHWFGSDHYGISPDIISMAKGLSSGYLPISAVAVSGELFAAIEQGGPLTHGYTYSGHPVSCAAAIANIDVIERGGLIDRVREETAPYFRGCLQQLADQHPIVGELRGAGLIAALQLVRDKSAKEIFTQDDDAANICRDLCLDNNLIMRAVQQSMVICPPLIITNAEIDELVDKAWIGLTATAERFGLM